MLWVSYISDTNEDIVEPVQRITIKGVPQQRPEVTVLTQGGVEVNGSIIMTIMDDKDMAEATRVVVDPRVSARAAADAARQSGNAELLGLMDEVVRRLDEEESE